MVKFAVVFGTRPEAIKMAPVVLAMRENPKWEVRVICTGQHLRNAGPGTRGLSDRTGL